MCRCTKRHRAECERVLNLAATLANGDGWRDKTRGQFELIDRWLYSLSLEGKLSIIADQWAGVYWEPYGSEKYPAKFKGCWIQCDSIVDGIAAAYVWLCQEEARVADS